MAEGDEDKTPVEGNSTRAFRRGPGSGKFSLSLPSQVVNPIVTIVVGALVGTGGYTSASSIRGDMQEIKATLAKHHEEAELQKAAASVAKEAIGKLSEIVHTLELKITTLEERDKKRRD